MRIRSFSFVCVCWAIMCLTACTESPKASENKIAVSIEPLRYVAEAIAGKSYTLQTLIPPGASPEIYQPTPGQLKALSESKAYIHIGTLGFERLQAERIAENMPHLNSVPVSKGIPIIEDGCGGHSEEGGDPHIWTSPKNMKKMAQTICEALSRVDMDNVETFKENLAAFSHKMDSLDGVIRERLKDIPSRTFLIYHPALAYFAEDYGLHQLSVQHNGKEASAEHLTHIVEKCRQEKVRVVFVQKEYSANVARTMAQEIGAEVVEINPLSYDYEKELMQIVSALNR